MRLLEQGAKMQHPGRLEDFDEFIQYYRSHSIGTNQLFKYIDELEAYRNAADWAMQTSTPQEAAATERAAGAYLMRKLRGIAALASETMAPNGSPKLSLVQLLLRQRVENISHYVHDEKQRRGLAAAMGGGGGG